jgi:hypothetical protein
VEPLDVVEEVKHNHNYETERAQARIKSRKRITRFMPAGGRAGSPDPYDRMIELLKAFKSDGHYFAVVGMYENRVGVLENGLCNKFRFGIQETGYMALRKILQTRTFDAMPGIRYRYFFAGGYSGSDGSGQHSISVHIRAQGDEGHYDFGVPLELLRNLLWFIELSDCSEASYLAEKVI